MVLGLGLGGEGVLLLLLLLLLRAEDLLDRVLLGAAFFLVSAAGAGFLYSGGVSTLGVVVSRLLLRRGEVVPVGNPRARRLGRLDATLVVLPSASLVLEADALDDALLREDDVSVEGIVLDCLAMDSLAEYKRKIAATALY